LKLPALLGKGNMGEQKPANQNRLHGILDLLLPFSKWQRIIFLVCCFGILAHLTVTVGRVGKKIGDYDVNREFGRRFLAGEYLYEDGQCFNYMPTSALYWAPLALVPPRVGMGLRYGAALICLALTIRMLRRMVFSRERPESEKSWAVTWVSLILAVHYLIRDFDDGGPYVILLAILVGGIYCFCHRREKLGAFWLGLGIAVKITPGLFLPFLIWKRQWRFAGYTCMAVVGWILLPALWMGPASWWRHQQEWNQVALSVFRDSPDGQREDNEQRVQNQALKPALMRYLVSYPEGHSLRLAHAGYVDFLNWSPAATNRAANLVFLGLWGLLCWRSRCAWKGLESRAILGEIAGLLLLVLLFSPVTWLQHFVFALPAIYWIVAEHQTEARAMTRWLLGCYIVLALVMNRELLGRENYLLLLSYHTHTICLLVLFALTVFRSRSCELQLQEKPYPSSLAA
jgi:hypothetical protein